MKKEDIYFYYRKKEYGWLSNFERSPQVVNGLTYPTNEHFYQSQKTFLTLVREWIRQAPSAWLAMKAGRSLRPKEMLNNWDKVKNIVMLIGLRAKFSQSPRLRKLLLETGDAEIHENSPTDEYWGVKGEDWLGKLLMQVREELKHEKIT